MIDFLMKRNQRPLNHNLGFHSHPTHSFKTMSPFSKSNHFKLRWPLDFGHSVKEDTTHLFELEVSDFQFNPPPSQCRRLSIDPHDIHSSHV
jgi:hypothetical protein